MDGLNTSFLWGRPIFRGYVSFRECTCVSWNTFAFPKRNSQVDIEFRNSEVDPSFHLKSRKLPSIKFQPCWPQMGGKKPTNYTLGSSNIAGNGKWTRIEDVFQTLKMGIFHCHVRLPEGNEGSNMFGAKMQWYIGLFFLNVFFSLHWSLSCPKTSPKRSSHDAPARVGRI